jgi:transcriptional regulator with XRE-family HTH domain
MTIAIQRSSRTMYRSNGVQRKRRLRASAPGAFEGFGHSGEVCLGGDRLSREEAAKVIRRLKEFANLSYESEATIAAKVGVSEYALNGWLSGKIKPRFESLLRVRAFLNRQPKTRGGIVPGYVRYSAITRMGGEGSGASRPSVCPLVLLVARESGEPPEKTL